MGLDMTEKCNRGKNPIDMVLHPLERQLSSDFLNLILSFKTPELNSYLKILWSSKSHQFSLVTMRHWILQIIPEHYRYSFERRLDFWGSTTSYYTFGPKCIRVFLWDNPRLSRADLDHGILHWVIWEFGMSSFSCKLYDAHKNAWEDWIELLSEVFMSQDQLYTRQYQVNYGLKVEFLAPLSPLFVFLCGVWCESDWERMSCGTSNKSVKILDRALAMWLIFVQTRWPKISLERYGNREVALMSPYMSETLWLSCWFFGRTREERMGPRLTGFKIGSRPDQWHIEWELNWEAFVGEFMHMVETSLGTEAESWNVYLPGSWPEDIKSRIG